MLVCWRQVDELRTEPPLLTKEAEVAVISLDFRSTIRFDSTIQSEFVKALTVGDDPNQLFGPLVQEVKASLELKFQLDLITCTGEEPRVLQVEDTFNRQAAPPAGTQARR